MNCTADLWTGCGVDDALTPVLDEQSIDAQVDRLLAELPPRFVLGGLSLGAIVAMALVARAPERVERLCLVSTNAKAPHPRSSRHRGGRGSTGSTPARARASLQTDILAALLSPAAARDRPDLVERTLAMADATGTATLRAQLRMQSTRVDLRPALRDVTVPTLLVSGAQDAICPPQFHAEIAAELPRARVVTIDGGHLLPLERPDAFGALVRAWRDPAPETSRRGPPPGGPRLECGSGARSQQPLQMRHERERQVVDDELSAVVERRRRGVRRAHDVHAELAPGGDRRVHPSRSPPAAADQHGPDAAARSAGPIMMPSRPGSGDDLARGGDAGGRLDHAQHEGVREEPVAVGRGIRLSEPPCPAVGGEPAGADRRVVRGRDQRAGIGGRVEVRSQDALRRPGRAPAGSCPSRPRRRGPRRGRRGSRRRRCAGAARRHRPGRARSPPARSRIRRPPPSRRAPPPASAAARR